MRMLQPMPSGYLTTRLGVVRFQFVATAGMPPAVVMTTHGVTPAFKWGELELIVRFLVHWVGSGWERTDAAEPYILPALGKQPIPDVIRKSVHDALIESLTGYVQQFPQTLQLSRAVEINNRIWSLEKKIAKVSETKAEFERELNGLLELERGFVITPVPSVFSSVPIHGVAVLKRLVDENCWISQASMSDATLHPYNSPTVLDVVPKEICDYLVTEKLVTLHRHLADGRDVYRVSVSGRKLVEKRV